MTIRDRLPSPLGRYLPIDRAPRELPDVGWRRALVTGASSGIGRSFAHLLADAGVELVVVARDRERLEALAAELDVAVEVLVADLADRSQLAAVTERLSADVDPVDVLINNAGFGKVGDFIDLDPDVETEVVDVNVTAMHRLAHAAGGAMAARGRGWILNVSSVAGFSPSPKTATYAATKAFVTSFSEALHVELGPQGVVVSCLCPGLTRTEFHQRADVDYHAAPDMLWQSADDVARAGLIGLAHSRALVVPGAHNKALAGVTKVAPAALVRRAQATVAKVNRR